MSKNQQPTVAYRLFHEMFLVDIPNKFLWTEGHLKRLPGLHSNDEDENRIRLNECTTVARTPVAMVLLYENGVVPMFKNRRDMLTIYNLILEHLHNWSRILSNPLGGQKPPPAEELLMMENFMMYLYEDAMFEHDTLEAMNKAKAPRDGLEAFFMTFGGRNALNARQRPISQPTSMGEMEPVPQPSIVPGSGIQTAWDNSPWSLISGHSGHTG